MRSKSPVNKRGALERLIGFFQSEKTPDAKRGRLLLESLEPRQLLAGDVDLFATDGNTALAETASQTSTLTSQTQPEGELVNDLVAFAQALTDAGVRLFHAEWCPFCTEQKELFEDGGDDLPLIEVTNPDRTLNDLAIQEGITSFPTWEFPNENGRVSRVLTLEEISELSGVAIPQGETPIFEDIGNQQVQIGSPLHIPVDVYDPDGGVQTVTVSVDDPDFLRATVLEGNRSIVIDMATYGDMRFELFESEAPLATSRVIELAEQGFYDGIRFHRVVDNFVIQAGDPLGNGTGGSNLGTFDDQFDVDLQHNRPGVLSFAKAGDDTNNSQFFITETPTPHLDFNHTVLAR